MLDRLMNVLAPPLTTEQGERRTRVYLRVLLGAMLISYIISLVVNTNMQDRLFSVLMIAYAVACLAFFTSRNMTFSRVSLPTVCLGVLILVGELYSLMELLDLARCDIEEAASFDKKKPLRVPMDRAKPLGVVKRLAPQFVIDNILAGLVKTMKSHVAK